MLAMLLVRAGPVLPLLPDCSLQESVIVQVARQVAQRWWQTELAVRQVSHHHTVGVLVPLHRRLLNSRNTICSLHHSISCLAPTGKLCVSCYWQITLTACSCVQQPIVHIVQMAKPIWHGT